MPLMQRRADTPHSVTGRALSILGVFGPGQTHLTLSEISGRTWLPTTTTFRLPREFAEWDALVRDAGRRYRFGRRVAAGAALPDATSSLRLNGSTWR